MALTALVVVSCQKISIPDVDADQVSDTEETTNAPTKKFTFTVKGEFQSPNFSYGAKSRKAPTYLSDNEEQMTDLWVLDYMEGVLQQQVHQSADATDWGVPTMLLKYGAHHIYFVTSRGETPTLNTEAGTIIWEKTKDTFWKDYEVTVVKTSNGNRAVTLDRIATKFSLVLEDVIPNDMATLSITPQTWYYGVNYMTGEAVDERTQERVISIPDSKHGAEGLSVSVFGICPSTEYTTDVEVVAKTVDNTMLGSASITSAPFQRNRVSQYTGYLFGENGSLSISLDSDWNEPYNGEF